LVVGERGEGETFPWASFKVWLLESNLGRFAKVEPLVQGDATLALPWTVPIRYTSRPRRTAHEREWTRAGRANAAGDGGALPGTQAERARTGRGHVPRGPRAGPRAAPASARAADNPLHGTTRG